MRRAGKNRLAVLVASAVVCVSAGFLLSNGTASAGAFDFCTYYLLAPATSCWGSYTADFFETESWSADDQGVGSCNGVGAGTGSGTNWYGANCIGDSGAPGLDAVYCTGNCAGLGGYAVVHDHSATYSDYFTGWEHYH